LKEAVLSVNIEIKSTRKDTIDIMKRILILFLAVCMLLPLFSCVANLDEDDPRNDPAQSGGNNQGNTGDPNNPAGPGGNVEFIIDESQIRGRTITLLHQGAGARTNMYMEEFSALYGCTMELVVAPWPSDAAKLISMIMSGDSPDIIDLSDEYLPLYALRAIAEPIDGFFDPDSPYIDREVMDGMKYKGRTYILHPNNRSPVMLFYNKSMFNRYGEDTPMDYYNRGEWTIDKLYEVARIFNEDTMNTGEIDQFGFVGTSVYEFLGANQLPLAEFDPVTSQFRLALGDQRQQEILQDAMDNVLAGNIQPFGWTASQLFPRGQLAMAGYEEWFANSLTAMEDEWSVAPYPTGKYGDPDTKYIRPWGVGVATGARNGYAGIQYQLYTYMRDEELRDETMAPWTGERGATREIARDKKSYFSLHIGIPNFRTVVDQINYEMIESGGKPFSALFEERRSELEAIVNDFNAIEEGWVEPKQFIYLGPVNFENGMEYLNMPPPEGVTQTIIDNGIDGKSLKITMDEEGFFPIFGSTVDSLSIAGGQREYRVTFDYEVISADNSMDPMFVAFMNPGQLGWAEQYVRNGDKGRAELRVSIRDDKPDYYLEVRFMGGKEILIDNFDIKLVE